MIQPFVLCNIDATTDLHNSLFKHYINWDFVLNVLERQGHVFTTKRKVFGLMFALKIILFMRDKCFVYCICNFYNFLP